MSIEYVVLKRDNDIKFTTHEFDQMPEHKRNTYKGYLCCPKCKADARYRKQSTDGKKSNFFAKHVEGCAWSRSNKGEKDSNNEDTNILESDISVFGIRWNYKNSKVGNGPSNTNGSGNSATSSGLNHVKNPSVNTSSKLSLSQILTYAEIDKLDDINLEVKLKGQTYDISDIVYEASQIDDSFIGDEFFFWGEMKYYNKNFINLRMCKDASIYMIPKIAAEFENRYKDKFFDVQKSNSMIVFGVVRQAQNGKKLIILDDCNKIYFRKK
jgi:hypothetical protein